MGDSSYNDWLGLPTNGARIQPRTTNILAEMGARAAQKILASQPTVPAPEVVAAPVPKKAEASQWSQMKDRVRTQPEVKWSLIIVGMLVLFGLVSFVVMMVAMRQRCKRDAKRHQMLLDAFEKQPTSLEHARVLSSPVEGGDSIEGSSEHLIQNLPPAAQSILTVAIVGVGNDMMQDFEQATDTTVEMTASKRHALLLSCQNRLNWMESLAVPPVMKQLNGFDVIDMKIRINSAIQDLGLDDSVQ